MNIGTFIGIVLIASVVFIGFGLIADNLDNSLIDTGIVNTTPISEEYRTNFNQTETIKEDFAPIEEGLTGLGEEGSWWKDLGNFVGAVPIVVIDFPRVIIGTLYDTLGNIKTILNQIGIPPAMVIIATLGLLVWIIFKLINFWKSGKEI